MHSCTFSLRSSIPRKIPRSRVHNQTAVVPAFCSFQKAKCFPLLRVHSALQQEKLCARRISRFNLVVGSSGLEPPTSRLSGVCSNQLSYEPISSARGRRLSRLPLSPFCAMQSFHFTQLRVHSAFPCGILCARRTSRLCLVVEMNGIEPMTPCLQSRCSPS